MRGKRRGRMGAPPEVAPALAILAREHSRVMGPCIRHKSLRLVSYATILPLLAAIVCMRTLAHCLIWATGDEEAFYTQAIESIWSKKRADLVRMRQHRNAVIEGLPSNDLSEKSAYDLIEPEWSCELEHRFGSTLFAPGDGPKYVCGIDVLREYEKCMIYSIGSSYDFTFEYAVSKVAPNCEIHTFDGTMNLLDRPLPSNLTMHNIHFHNWNIIADCTSDYDGGHDARCFQRTLESLDHRGKTISWFKIDCEGCEYEVIPHLLMSSVKVEQLFIEVHGTTHAPVLKLFNALWDADFIIFHKESNHWGCDGYRCVEFSLMSPSYARQVSEQYVRGSWSFHEYLT